MFSPSAHYIVISGVSRLLLNFEVECLRGKNKKTVEMKTHDVKLAQLTSTDKDVHVVFRIVVAHRRDDRNSMRLVEVLPEQAVGVSIRGH